MAGPESVLWTACGRIGNTCGELLVLFVIVSLHQVLLLRAVQSVLLFFSYKKKPLLKVRRVCVWFYC